MAKTPGYTRKAVDEYQKKYDITQIRLPKGTKDRAKAHNISVNDIAVSAVLAYLDDLESKADNLPQYTEKTAEKADTERTEVDEKVALMQANDRLHALQEQTRAAKKERKTATAADLAKTFIDNCN